MSRGGERRRRPRTHRRSRGCVHEDATARGRQRWRSRPRCWPSVRSDSCPHVLGESRSTALREVEQKLTPLSEDPAQEARHPENNMTVRHGLEHFLLQPPRNSPTDRPTSGVLQELLDPFRSRLPVPEFKVRPSRRWRRRRSCDRCPCRYASKRSPASVGRPGRRSTR
jgi:hypothetical protein